MALALGADAHRVHVRATTVSQSDGEMWDAI